MGLILIFLREAMVEMQSVDKWKTWTEVVLAVCIASLLVGCGKATDRHGMSGTVKLNGSNLASGSIRFDSVAGHTPLVSTGAMIKEGVFLIPDSKGLPPGSYRVIINAASAPTVTPGPPGSQPVMETKELIPQSFNSGSDITVEVSADRENEFNFDIP